MHGSVGARTADSDRVDIIERLSRAREEQGLDLHALERRTHIRVHLLEAVEQGRFDKLPRGVYARAIVRAYATAVGIDPNRAIVEVASLLPDMEDPLDGLARVRGLKRPAVQTSAAPAVAPAVPRAHQSEWGFPIDAVLQKRAAASAIDGGLLTAIQVALVGLTARTAGVSVASLFEFATTALVLLFVLIPGLYFLLLGGVGGATIGAQVMGCEKPGRLAVNPSLIFRRAGYALARELSILVDLMLPWFGVPVSGDDYRDARDAGEHLTSGRIGVPGGGGV